MSDLKMSVVFDLPVSVDGHNLNDGYLGGLGDSTIANFDCEFVSDLSEQMAKHAAHAINSHDRLEQENADLNHRVKDLSACVNVSVSRNNDLKQEVAELREALQSVIVNSTVKTRGNDMLVKSGAAIYGEPLRYEVSLSAINKAKQLLNK